METNQKENGEKDSSKDALFSPVMEILRSKYVSTDEVDILKRKNAELETKVSEQELELKKLNESLQRKEEIIISMTKENEKFQQTISEHESQISGLSNTISDLSKEVEEAENKISELQSAAADRDEILKQNFKLDAWVKDLEKIIAQKNEILYSFNCAFEIITTIADQLKVSVSFEKLEKLCDSTWVKNQMEKATNSKVILELLPKSVKNEYLTWKENEKRMPEILAKASRAVNVHLKHLVFNREESEKDEDEASIPGSPDKTDSLEDEDMPSIPEASDIPLITFNDVSSLEIGEEISENESCLEATFTNDVSETIITSTETPVQENSETPSKMITDDIICKESLSSSSTTNVDVTLEQNELEPGQSSLDVVPDLTSDQCASPPQEIFPIDSDPQPWDLNFMSDVKKAKSVSVTLERLVEPLPNLTRVKSQETSIIALQASNAAHKRSNTCRHCGKRFFMLSVLKSHSRQCKARGLLLIAGNKDMDEKITRSNAPPISKKMKGQQVGASTSRKQTGSLANEKDKSTNREYEHKCKCNLEFWEEEAFKEHARRCTVYSKGRSHDQYKCLKCHRIYKYKWDLTRHSREKHKLTSKMSCYLCGSCFKTPQGLSSHLNRIHKISKRKGTTSTKTRVIQQDPSLNDSSSRVTLVRISKSSEKSEKGRKPENNAKTITENSSVQNSEIESKSKRSIPLKPLRIILTRLEDIPTKPMTNAKSTQ